MSRHQRSYFKMGDWNAICDYCGGTFKASELRIDWKGFMACAKDWEPRHPQDFVRGIPDQQSPPWIRPRLAPNFVNVTAAPPPTGGTGTGGGTGGGPAPPPPPPPPAPSPSPSPTPAPAPATSSLAGIAIAGSAVTGL